MCRVAGDAALYGCTRVSTCTAFTLTHRTTVDTLLTAVCTHSVPGTACSQSERLSMLQLQALVQSCVMDLKNEFLRSSSLGATLGCICGVGGGDEGVNGLASNEKPLM